MGEFIEGSTGSGALNYLSAAFCVGAMVLFALFQTDQSDDDDSNGGGGLMQPIS